MSTQILAVIDLQFGSTGKGQIAGTIAHKWGPDTVATAWGPNAGHTFKHEDKTWVHRALATSALAPSVRNILVGPGSVVDLPRLGTEISLARDLLHGKHLIIHPQAAILCAEHADRERVLVKIGSTMKGTMEAMYDKMRRDVDFGATAGRKVGVCFDELHDKVYEAGLSLAVSSDHYDRAIKQSNKLILEGAQGFSLGIHTDFYPYTTSRDVSTAQMFADCRVPFPLYGGVHVVGVARTFPIRVANRHNDLGHQVGTSGGCYPDQEEIDWKDIGQEPELTTVTKLPRRIFTFSRKQIEDACHVCRPTSIALTFCDYMTQEGVASTIKAIEAVSRGARVKLLSYGPTTNDMRFRLWPKEEVIPISEVQGDSLGSLL